ncbi:calcium-binding protein [Moorena sp. SIO3H5]|uniref:calcium-binding protein n=1 Tax=Moorena sp. SIO3H5 TaxID=2607834 RepID=UPI0025EBAA66|nr:calcium-binding protein [Moorena sp. SIO3H5]
MNTDFLRESTDLVANVLYARPLATYDSMAASGAVGINADWENNESQSWYIEAQRQGEEAILSGLINDDQAAIEAGLTMFDWGFAQQSADGGFEGTGDPFHSTSLFIHAVARSLLLIQGSSYSQQYADVIEGYKEKLSDAADWMIQPEVWETGTSNNEPYTHRRYVVGTALGLTSQLTGNSELMDYARQSLADGLALQQPDGVNPELGGYDSSYQMVGVLYAAQWVSYFPEESLTAEVIEMINDAIAWEQTRILPDGQISTEGNTRTSGQEILRSGELKNINNREIIRGLAYWASVTQDQDLTEDAYEVGQFYYADDLSLMPALYPGDDIFVGTNDQDNIFSGDGDDLIRTDKGNDIIEGNNGNDTLKGGKGNDNLDGNAGNDYIDGSKGDDTLSGGEGDDLLNGGADNDLINGDAGDDTLKGDKGKDTLNGGVGSDTLDGGQNDDTLNGGEGDDFLNGRAGNDRLNGDAGHDFLYGDRGDDELRSGTDNDTLFGSAGNDTLYAGEGNDFLDGGAHNDLLNGDAGDDSLYGDRGEDTLNGGVGSDILDGGKDNDTLNGGEGDDFLNGRAGNDRLNGDAGHDSLYGGLGNDELRSGTDNDTLFGHNGNDTLYAGDGNDFLNGGVNNDLLNGDAGNDTLQGDQGEDTLNGGVGNDILYGGQNHDTLNGGDGDDTLTGDVGHDLLNGDAGNDSLYRGKGNDQLNAGIGNDILYGGEGIDTLTGGAGADKFVLGKSSVYYNTNGASDYALISDFNIAEGDQIELQGEASDYLLQESVALGSSEGTGIYRDTNKNGIYESTDELIALLNGSEALNLYDITTFIFN